MFTSARFLLITTLLSTLHLTTADQGCDTVNDQPCCYASDTTAYCCAGSLVGDSTGSSLDGIICCNNEPGNFYNINIGFGVTTCKSGTATPLTALPTASTGVVAAIQSLDSSRSASRASLFASASASRASAAATRSGSTTAQGTDIIGSGITSTHGFSTLVTGSGLVTSTGAVTSGAGAAASSSAASASASAASAASSTGSSTGGAAAMVTGNPWMAVVGGMVLAAGAI